MTYKLALGFAVLVTVMVLAVSCGYLEEDLEYQRAAPQTLVEKLEWLNKNARNNKEYVFTVNGEESLDHCYLDCNYKTNVTVRLQGGTVTLSGSGSMFTVKSGITLILDNIILKGSSNNKDALVEVYGGKLEMRTGSVITGNSNTSSIWNYGGGVYVHSEGTFTMSGGKISGNTASRGGGVYVSCKGGLFNGMEAGTFTMSGGEISGNAAVSGGGVYVDRNSNYYKVDEAIFTMSGGKISGNTASSSSSFSTPYGGGVYVGDGIFTMSGGEIYGNTAYSPSLFATSYGGGVYVGSEGTFTKIGGGSIYGYTGDAASNVVILSGAVLSNRGHAVYVSDSKRRESTAGPIVNLDSNVEGAAGGWEN